MRRRRAAPATSATSSPSIRSARWSAASLVGALAAFLLPRTEREDKLLGTTGKKITTAAREAAQRGLDAGREQLDEIRTKAAEKVGAAVADVVGGKQ